MQITFRIHYATAYGQRVELLVDDTTPMPLEWAGGGWWRATIDMAPGAAYRYRVVLGAEVVAVELGPARTAPEVAAPVTVVDRWRLPDPSRLSRQSAFFRRARSSVFPGGARTAPPAAEVTFRLVEPAVPAGHHPAVVGAAAALGAWDVTRAVPLGPSPYPWWETHIGTAAGAYKYVLLDSTGSVAEWEAGPDRMLPDLEGAGTVIVNDDEIRGLPEWRGAGVAVPVFALRSERDVGVGQFTDLEQLADWAAGVGLSVIQLLPVNDTVLHHDWDDSYPYNPTSVQALHPLYIDLDDIAGDETLRARIEAARREVNDLPEIDYVRVMELKWQLLRAAYEAAAPSLDHNDAFADFVDREWEWLGPYSAWCALRDRNGTPDFRAWGEHAVFDAATVTAMATPGAAAHDDLRFHWFVQFHLHRQLTGAADYARSRGVALKGDLPIGVAPESAEVWTMPDLFHVGAQTGAPPDAFAVRGQNWEFPTYDWDRMAADGYQWWQARFRALARYVDAYRIDHVLGFFRIWEIPRSADDGLLGYFRPSLPLAEAEVHAALGDVDVSRLVRPLIDPAGMEARFGTYAALVRAEFFEEVDGLLGLVAGAATQRRIMEAFDDGAALAALPADDRTALRRAVLDAAAEVLLVEVDGGYQPRISWEATEPYRRLTPDQQVRFDALAIDFFHHRHTAQWEQQGRTTLPAVVAATDLLACGEDLGMVPDLVPRLMNEMGLLSLEIERMPKRLGAWIADPAEAPYLSVVSPSTHDTTTIRMWWEEDRALIDRYWREALREEGEPPATATPAVCEAIVRRQLASPAMLCVIPMSDLIAIDGELRRQEIATERINDPANRHNKWRYRLQLSLADLAAAGGFNERLRTMIREHAR